MYEHRRQPLLTYRQFFHRILRHGLLAFAATVVALAIGVGGYFFLGHLPFVDSLLNASMILGGMGPVDALPSNAAKVFASFYALFSGLFFIGVLAVLLAPFVHRIMHHFHLEESRASKKKSE